MKFWVPECLEMRGTEDPAKCSQPTAEVIASPSPIETLPVQPANVHFVDLTRYFCDEKHCLPVIGNVIVYRDPTHITATYAKTLAPMLLREMSPGLPEGWVTRHAQGSTGDGSPTADTARNASASAGSRSRLAVAE